MERRGAPSGEFESHTRRSDIGDYSDMKTARIAATLRIVIVVRVCSQGRPVAPRSVLPQRRAMRRWSETRFLKGT